MTYSAFIAQIEHQLAGAKSAATEAEIRESLAAIRAVCDVGLNSKAEANNARSVSVQTSLQQSEPVSLHSQSQVMQPTEKPLAEEDANGESLFDF
ncbi:YwdI family protein [Paenisporosarcina cavernae]|uniref:Uncharacterized protein n=1 Tax=Paenisporosarcina cavernae TaxID=2320858 RepID=A0A385YPW8_9BACL|nr:YwdI family protein [Paenisporosarcina cavernae]AYC28775.1 hypothetical protein D3873_02395 [Paenisporosarcina cavernae]